MAATMSRAQLEGLSFVQILMAFVVARLLSLLVLYGHRLIGNKNAV